MWQSFKQKVREQIARKTGEYGHNKPWEHLTGTEKESAFRITQVNITLLKEHIEGLGVISKEQQDNCTPSTDELNAYLAEPDDEIAADLRAKYPELFRIIGRCVLYGEKIAQAQLQYIKDELLKEMK